MVHTFFTGIAILLTGCMSVAIALEFCGGLFKFVNSIATAVKSAWIVDHSK